MSEEPTDVPDGELWVLEGTLDLPVFFQSLPSAGGRGPGVAGAGRKRA